MRSYLELLQHILDRGSECFNQRTGQTTLRVIGPQLELWVPRFFPLVTTRYINFGNVISELDWFLYGGTNIHELHEADNHIWDKWALTDQDVTWHRHRDKYGNKIHVGDCGPIYGAQWTRWKTSRNTYINQITNLVSSLSNDPYSRRHIVSAWNPEYLPDERKTPQENVCDGNQALAPCHTLFQVFVEPAAEWVKILYAGPEFYSALLQTYPYLIPLHYQILDVAFKKKLGFIRKWFNRGFDPTSVYELFDQNVFCEEVFAQLPKSTRSAFSMVLNTAFEKDDKKYPVPPSNMMHLKLYARSQDVPVGTVFNIASYTLLLYVLANRVGMIPGKYIHTMGDAHIYTNQILQVEEQLSREPFLPPRLIIKDGEESPCKSFLLKPISLVLEEYKYHPAMKYKVAL